MPYAIDDGSHLVSNGEPFRVRTCPNVAEIASGTWRRRCSKSNRRLFGSIRGIGAGIDIAAIGDCFTTDDALKDVECGQGLVGGNEMTSVVDAGE